MLDTDDLRHHTEVGTGYSKEAQLSRAADEIDRLRGEVDTLLTLAEDAHEAWNNDKDARVGKLLLAMMDEVFRKTYRPDLVKVGAGETAPEGHNAKVTGAA